MLSDEVLVEKARSGDKLAFEELVERYRKPVYVASRRICGNSQDTEDIFQEVFITVFRSMGQFDATKASFKTWLFNIVKSRCIDSFRRAKTWHSFDGESIDELVADQCRCEGGFEAIELEDTLRLALAELTEEQRICLTLKTIGGLSYEEIARTLDIPIGTVRSRVSSARKRLAGQMLYPLEGDTSCNVVK